MVRTRKRAALIVGALVVVLVSSLGIEILSYRRSPKYAANKFMEAKEKGDFARMYSMASSSTRRRLTIADFKERYKLQPGFKERYELGRSVAMGGAAVVEVTLLREFKATASNPGGGTFSVNSPLSLVKESERWKVEVPPEVQPPKSSRP
jgi:hypothetical protein